MPKKVPDIDIDEADFPVTSTAAQRDKALSLIGISKDSTKTLAEKLAIVYDNSAMLGMADKKVSTADRLRTLFQQQNFSPITRLLRLVKIEEAKMEAYNRALDYGIDPKLLKHLPQPDKKFYANLLLQLARYEVPELKAVEITGEIKHGMSVHIVQHTKQQKVIRVDEGAPENLKRLFGTSTDKTLQVALEPVVVPADDDDI